MCLLAKQELLFDIGKKQNFLWAIQSNIFNSGRCDHFAGIESSLDQVNEPNVPMRIWNIGSRFLEFHVHTSCKESRPLSLSLEYSRNIGLTWQLFRYLTLNFNQSSIVHEDLLNEMMHDDIQIRFVLLTAVPKCWKLDQVTETKDLKPVIRFDLSIDYCHGFQSSTWSDLCKIWTIDLDWFEHVYFSWRWTIQWHLSDLSHIE